MTTSVGDLLDDHFETDALKGAYASTGVVGVWAGPRTPGTAYNLLHHDLGEIDGVGGAWGHVRGGMGGISEAIAASARAAGADVRTGRRRRRPSTSATAPSAASRSTGGEELTATDGPLRRAPAPDGARPRRRRALPGGGRRRRCAATSTRGGSVKVNAVLVRAAALRARRRRRAPRCCTRASRSARRSTTSSAPGRTPRAASRPAEPYIEVEVPTVDRPVAHRRRHHVLTMFTQYGPWSADDWGRTATARPTGRRCFDILARTRRTSTTRSLHYEVLAPPDLEEIFGLEGGSIFQGEQGLDQMAFMRPCPEMAQYATPVDGLYLCGAGTHPGGGVMGVAGHNAANGCSVTCGASACAHAAPRGMPPGEATGRPTDPVRHAARALRRASRRGRRRAAGRSRAARTPPRRPRRRAPAARQRQGAARGPDRRRSRRRVRHPARAARLPGHAAAHRATRSSSPPSPSAAASCTSTTTPTTSTRRCSRQFGKQEGVSVRVTTFTTPDEAFTKLSSRPRVRRHLPRRPTSSPSSSAAGCSRR